MFNHIDFTNWYWYVGGDQTRAFSSAVGDYVPAADATFQTWLAAGNKPTKIDTEANLGAVLAQFGLTPITTAIADATNSSLFDAIPRVVRVWAFAIENRVRALEGQAARTPAQFKTYVKSLL